MDRLFQSKWFIRIISLALAITLYIFVTVETNVTQDESRLPSVTQNELQILEEVPLGIKIDSDQYVVSGVPEYVTVTLEGKTSILTPIVKQLNFNVFVDLQDLSEGEHTVDVEHENLPENITAYIEPKTIDVVIEKRMAKEFTVDVDLVNEDKLPLGYELGEPVVNPDTVTIISSETIIDQIAMVKVFIDVTDLKESIENRELPVTVYDIQGNDLSVRVEPENVLVSLDVERPSKTVPLNVLTKGELQDELEIIAIEADEDIEVFGKRQDLNELSSLNTKEIDLSQITKSDIYKVELDFPEGIIANETEVEVYIELEDTKQFENVSIDTTLGDGTTFSILEPDHSRINIRATGKDEDIQKLKKTDIRAFVATENLSEGTHEVELSIEGPSGISFESEVDQITISIP